MLNGRSIANKSQQLEEVLLLYDPHLLAVTETWLSPNITDSEIIPPSHKIVRRDREGRGGGVAIIAKKEVDIIRLENIPEHESIWCEIRYRIISTLFGVVYRPPNSPVSYIELLANYLDRMLTPNKKCVLTGDFNLPGIDWNALAISGYHDVESARLLLDSAFFHDLKQIVTVPTRVTETTQSILDLIFIKDFPGDCTVSTANGIADHKLVNLNLLIKKTTPTPPP